MPAKAVIPQPMPSWAGFYIGGHGGYGWKDDPFSYTLNAADPNSVVTGFKSRGWIGGGHFGYNWQYGAMVGGFELDLSATGIRGISATGTTSTVPGTTFSQSYGHDARSGAWRPGFPIDGDQHFRLMTTTCSGPWRPGQQGCGRA